MSVTQSLKKKKKPVTFGPKCLIFIISLITFPTDYTSWFKRENYTIHKQLDEIHICPWQLKMTLLWKWIVLLSVTDCLAGKMSHASFYSKPPFLLLFSIFILDSVFMLCHVSLFTVIVEKSEIQSKPVYSCLKINRFCLKIHWMGLRCSGAMTQFTSTAEYGFRKYSLQVYVAFR